MKRLACGILSSLVILSAAGVAKAEAPTFTIAQDLTTIEQMYEQQRVLTNDIQTLMTQMKTVTAEMKALTASPPGKAVTMSDLYKQQQALSARMDMLIGRTRYDTIQPTATRPKASLETVQSVQQQQQMMIAEMKEMMAEMKKTFSYFEKIYREKYGS
jgi:HD superfamily phosphodiesterase